MFTQLWLNKMLFMLELLVAEHMFVASRKRKEGYVPRMVFSYMVCILVAFFFPILAYNAFYASFLFLVLFVVTVMFMKFCYDESWLTVLFCCFAAFTVKEIAYAISQLIVASSSFFIGGGDYASPVKDMLIGSYGNSSVQITSMFYFLSDLTFYSVVYLVFGLLFAERLKKEETLHLQNISFFLYAFLIEISVIILNAVVVYHSREAFDQVYYVIFMVFMAFGCITSLVLQFNMLRNEQLRDEILLFSYLLGEKEKQYLASKESVDIINQKCHDLKHMVKSWRHGRGIDDQELKDIEKAISIYDSVVKTGNETLDVILTEKSLICSHYGIRLTCLAEAERLNFIRDTDLYILFGNILDNAIEAVRKIEIPEKRVIALNIKRVNEMLVVNVRNYYEGKIIMEDGLPVTGKEDTNFHGFGMKSIRRIVEQYDGSLSLDTDNGLFKVNILFPSM